MTDHARKYGTVALLMAMAFSGIIRTAVPPMAVAVLFAIYAIGLLGYQQARAWPVGWVSVICVARALSSAPISAADPLPMVGGITAGVLLSLFAANAWGVAQKGPSASWIHLVPAALLLGLTWLR